MNKTVKKICGIAVAATLCASALSLAACGGTKFEPVAADNSQVITGTQGGFLVATNDYYYFINGVEAYTADNTYGEVVKGALKRVKKGDALNAAKAQEAETVIPSLMVAGNYEGGIYLYGGRIYYATPTDVKNQSGEVQNSYLDFKSAKTDGSDVKHHFREDNNSVNYRFVEVDGVVYVLYVKDSNLHSFNTATATDTVLVEGASTYLFNKTDKTNAYVYYTMKVQDKKDSDNPLPESSYNQIYRVRADATKDPYNYTWDQDWLDENNDGKIPYINYGELVLDGRGTLAEKTKFNHSNTKPTEPAGYSYTVQTYDNNGLYFTRENLSQAGDSQGAGASLYYLAESKLTGLDSVSGNKLTSSEGGALEVVASATNTSKASSSAIFYIDGEGQHHYIYVDGDYMRRADVKNDGKGTMSEIQIAYGVSGATLLSRDETADYGYVYYTTSSGSGLAVNRAVYTGTEKDYANLQFYTEDTRDLYAPVRILGVQHASSWYAPEILDGILFYANSESFGSVSYNYVYTVNLKNDSNALMTNRELKELKEDYEAITDTYFSKVSSDVSANASTAAKYYFYTGDVDGLFAKNIQEALDAGKKATYLYTQKEQDFFKAYKEGTEKKDNENMPEDGVSRRLTDFTNILGTMSDDDTEALREHWKTTLRSYTAPEEEETGLPVWAWVLIGVGCALVVAGAVLTTVLVLRKKKKAQGENKPEKMRVDTTDDKDVDVYATAEEEPVPEKEIEEPTETLTPVEEPAPVEEPTPAEEPAPVEEPTPAEEPAPAEEPTPAEEPADDKPQE